MEILRQPDSLSLLGNLKEFLISSQENVTFTLSTEIDGVATTLLTESYIPDAFGRITIDVKEVCRQYLKTELPGDNVVAQENAARTFTATIGATSVTFRVVNASVRNLALTPADFLEYNFLTLQPQTKKVSWHSPEYLSYYFVGTADIKAKFYLVSGDTETVTVTSITPEVDPGEIENGGTIRLVNKVYTVNTTLSRLMALSSHSTDELQGIVDVWVEQLGDRKSYIQRYVYAPATGDEHHYLAVNSLGGIDTFTFHGEQKISGEIEHQVAENNDLKISVTKDGQRKYRQITGYLGVQEAEWLWEFLHSNQQWVVADGTAEAIALQSSSLSQGDITALNSSSFDFVLAREGGLLPESRRDETFPDITVPSPVSDLFFLTPRLIDFPAASGDSKIVFPVQTPYSNTWKYLTLSALSEKLSLSIIPDHTHGNLSILNELGDVDGHLTYRGNAIGSGNGITLPIAITDVDGLRTVLNSKAGSNHTHHWTDISDRPLRLSDLDDNVVRGYYLPLSAGNDNPLTGTLYAQTILPAGNAYDLGSSVSKWNDGYFNGTIYSADLSVAGSLVVTGLSTLAGGADVSTLLAIPTSAPSSPDSGKSYLWIDTTGNYAESISGGGSVANVYDLTLVKGNTQLGKFQPAVAAKTIDIASAFSGYATQDWVSSHFNNYSLPKASANTLGGIKVGNGLTIDNNGVLTPYVVEDSMLVLANDGTLGVNVEQLLLVTQNVVEGYGYTQKTQAIPYIVGPSSDAAGVWTGSCDGITAYADGLTIIYVPGKAGKSAGVTLNINGLGAMPCYRTATGAITTQYAVGEPILLTYRTYSGSGRWMRADYDSNTNTQIRVYRQTTGYNDDYPIIVSRTKVIGTSGSDGSYTAVYGVIGDSNIPTINPSTGLLKATTFQGALDWSYITNKPTLGTAAPLDSTSSITSGGTGLPTARAVYTYVNNAITAAQPYKGASTTAITDGGTEMPTISGYTTRTKGDVVAYNKKEFIWEGTAWRELGDEGSYALKTTSVIAGSGLTGGGQISQDVTLSLSAASIASLGKADTAYQKPSGGIPKTDLASGVQTSLGNADSALQSGDMKNLTLKVGTSTVQADYNALTAKTYTISKQNLTDTIGSTTYAPYDSAGYLPLSAGSGKPLTNTLYLRALLPTTTATYDIGSSRVKFKDLYLSGSVNADDIIGSGDLTIGGEATFNSTVTIDSGAEINGYLAIPTSAPSNPTSGKSYLWCDSTGNYSETPSGGGGGTGDIYALTITIDGGTPIVYNPSVEPKSISVTNHSHSNKSVLDGITSTDITAWNAKYYKPSGGIPKTDLASAVQTSLGNADTAYGWGNHASAGYASDSVVVKQIKIGTASALSPTNGLVTLPAYPTSLPASDVYDWAKASTKPTYTLSEITGTDDLRAIEAITGASGLLKKTAANTWSLDTNTYLTSSSHKALTLKVGTTIIGSDYTSLATKTYTITKANITDTIGSTTYAPYNADGYVPTTRTVNGHALSSDVAVTKGDVGLGNVENTALSTWTGTNKITTIGTITTGTWQGTAIANSYLANSSVTINSKSLSLGGSLTLKLSDLTDDILSGHYLPLSGGTLTGALNGTSASFSGNINASGHIIADGTISAEGIIATASDFKADGDVYATNIMPNDDMGCLGGQGQGYEWSEIWGNSIHAYTLQTTIAEVSGNLAIPTATPTSPTSGKIYLYASSLGEYAVEPWYGFNQLISNGNMESTTGWGTVYSGYTRTVENNVLTLTITSATYRPQVRTALSVANGHWVYYTYTMKYTTSAAYSDVKTAFLYPTPLYIPTGNQKDADYYNWKKTSGIVKVNAAKTYLYIGRTASSSHTFAVGDTVQIKNVMVCDLTEMFGENIPTVEQFEAMYPQDYYEYTPIGG